MLRVSNVLNRYFNEGKILKYLSLPGLEYVIEYRKDGEIKIASVKFTNMDNIADIENKINEVIEWNLDKYYRNGNYSNKWILVRYIYEN